MKQHNIFLFSVPWIKAYNEKNILTLFQTVFFVFNGKPSEKEKERGKQIVTCRQIFFYFD